MPNVVNVPVAKVLGATVAGSFILRSLPDGTAITGKVAADFAVAPVAALMPDGDVTAPVTLTELGDGRYGYQYTPTEVGDWSFFERYDADNEWLDTAYIVSAFQSRRPGQTIGGQVLLRDAFGDPITGKVTVDFDIPPMASLMPSGSPSAVVTFTEIGDGRYGYSFTPTVAGDWELYYLFDADNEWLDRFTVTDAPERSAANPVSANGSITLYRGDDYQASEGRALSWDFDSASDLAGADIKLTIASRPLITKIVAVASDAELPTQTVTVDLASAQTTGLKSGTYALSATLANGHEETLATGTVVMLDRIP